MTVGAFIIVRLSSSRLPRKNIMKIMGKPMIELMIERVRCARSIDKIVITTSTEQSDDPLEVLAAQLGVDCYRGSLESVMERICGAASHYDCDTIVELLGDNPLVHGELIDDVIELYEKGDYDYVATLTKEYEKRPLEGRLFSVGLRVQAYSTQAAGRYLEFSEYIMNSAKHPSAYIFDHPEVFSVEFLQAVDKWGFMNRPDLNFAVNYAQNFNLLRYLFETLYPRDAAFSLEEVYRQLDRDPFLYLMMGTHG